MNITFGQYYPGNSVVHRIDPRIKILLTIVFIVMIFLIDSFVGYGILALFILALILLSRIPFIQILKSIKTIVFLLIFTSLLNIFFNSEGNVLAHWWIFTITDGGLKFAAMMAIRLTSLIIGTSLLTLTTTPTQLTDGIESLLRPLKVVKIPVHDIALTMSIALRFIPTLMEETEKIMKAQKARGASFDEGGLIKRAKALLPILIPLFVSSIRRADELALALDSRCYNATPKRTKYKTLKLSFIDYAATLIYLGLLAFYIVWKINPLLFGILLP